jgi:hypothetical protein
VAVLLPLDREVADAISGGIGIADRIDRRAFPADARGAEGAVGAGAFVAPLHFFLFFLPFSLAAATSPNRASGPEEKSPPSAAPSASAAT